MEIKATNDNGGRWQAGLGVGEAARGWGSAHRGSSSSPTPLLGGRGAPIARSSSSLEGEGRGRLGDEAVTSDLAEPIGDWPGEGA